MEDRMTSSLTTGTGSSSVAMVTDLMGTDPQQSAGSTLQSDGHLRNRIKELERSERSLLVQLCQLASASHLPSMQHSQRLDQRLHMLREEVRNMTQEKERGERAWRDRLQRCQRQLKAKEDEMSRQSQYFENFKTQLQHKLSLARDREHSLQNRIYTLEKQLLDMTVSAATGTTAIGAIRITAGTVTHWGEQERLPPMRGEGEGEEERKEERRRQWQPSVRTDRDGGREAEKETQGGRVKDTKQSSNEARLQGFILSLQEDLRVLLEREEDGVTERRGLMEQLQEAQENTHFLGCRVEEMKAVVHQLKLSESSLLEEVEDLREENHRLQQILPANQTPSQSAAVPESTYLSSGTKTLSYITAMGHTLVGSPGEVTLKSDEGTGQPQSSAVPPVHHQVTAESAQNNTQDHPSAAKSETKMSHHFSSTNNPSLQSLSLTTETLDEFKLGTWCCRGILNLEESPSEECDALREAYRSLRLGEDLEALREQRDRMEGALEHTQEKMQVIDQENARLKTQLRKEKEAEQVSPREKIGTMPISDGAEDETILALAHDDLVQGLNQENRALADRIQELLAHVELREEEIKREKTQQREHVSKLEADRVRLKQENHEQECLITELTKKTEDDLNTIMELQQRLVDSEQRVEESQGDKELFGSQLQSECTAAISGSFQQNNLEECVDGLVESMLKGEEPQLMSSQQPDDLIAASTPGSQLDNHYDPSQDRLQNSLLVTSSTDQVGQLSLSIQSLKTEEEELSGCVNSLREQQREVALSVQTQTEVKQQLTRTVWGLKEEKDIISQSLAALKQEREQLTRTVCGLKEERGQIIKSMSGLKEERESLSGLQREKEKLLAALSSGKEERDRIMQSLQSLQTESGQLSQAVLYLKQERDELTDSLKCLKEQRDGEQSSNTSQEACEKLVISVSSLREEKERIEHSIICLKQEEKQIKLFLQGLRQERNSLDATLPIQTQTEGRNQTCDITTQKSETLVGTGAMQRCQTHDHTGNSVQEQSDLMREIEALGAELKRSRDDLEKSHEDNKRLHSELSQSEDRREEVERKAAQAADKVTRLTDVAHQMEETRRENESLTAQVKELQSKLSGLVREKTDALSLKAQTEEQYNILSAQLKAKTVALEELNSEYIALKRGQGSKDDVSAVLVSLRTRYDDVRAKYDALLKKRSQNDLDIAPLKAKLSCLVLKCQERNSLLVQMKKAMHKQGCVDSTLTQQVEQLLSDVALQDYAAAFTPGSNVTTRDHTTRFTTGFISKFQDYNSVFTPDQTHSTTSPPGNQQNGFATKSGEKCQELQSEKHTPLVTTESTRNLQDCSIEVTPAPRLKTDANSPVPTSPVQEPDRVKATPSPDVSALKESFITNTAQLSPSANGPEKFRFYYQDMKGKSSEATSSIGSSLSLTPPCCSPCVSPSRRLSSPEKILNLHEQLQKTLMSSYQAPESRGRGQQPRKCLSFSAPADLRPASQTQQQSLSSDKQQTNSLPVTAAASRAKHTPAYKPTTLFNAVASRSANVTLSPSMFTNRHFKADTSKTMSALSSSSNFTFTALAPCKSNLSSGTKIATSPELVQKITAVPDISDAKHTASTPSTQRTITADSYVLIYSDTNPNTTASHTTAPSLSTAPESKHFNTPSKMDSAAAADHEFAASCTRPAHSSPERSNKSARKSAAAPEKTKTGRPKPGAPAEVCSVEVIKTVGQSSLMIGWERPPLDELGCSNGTFVYGYRVFVDGDFHKSVMSSACTKCILENVDLSVPVHISVQTLGSNGLSSNFVHTMYRTSIRTDHH